MFDLASAAVPPPSNRHRESRPPTNSILMDTAAAPPAEQFELFRSWYAGLADIRPQLPPGTFLARQTAWSFGRLTLTHVGASQVSYAWQSVRNPTIDSWCLHLPLPRAPHRAGSGIGALSLLSLADQFEGRS